VVRAFQYKIEKRDTSKLATESRIMSKLKQCDSLLYTSSPNTFLVKRLLLVVLLNHQIENHLDVK
jgi:hypothetical protein